VTAHQVARGARFVDDSEPTPAEAPPLRHVGNLVLDTPVVHEFRWAGAGPTEIDIPEAGKWAICLEALADPSRGVTRAGGRSYWSSELAEWERIDLIDPEGNPAYTRRPGPAAINTQIVVALSVGLYRIVPSFSTPFSIYLKKQG